MTPLDPHYPERCPLCHVLCDYETGEPRHSDRCTVPAHDVAVAAKTLHKAADDVFDTEMPAEVSHWLHARAVEAEATMDRPASDRPSASAR